MNKQITVFAGVLIKDNKVLLNLRNEPEAKDAHLKWEFPGGKCDFGETPQEAVVREFKEETGRVVKVKQLLPYVETNYWDYEWGRQQTLCFVFLCELIKDGEPEVQDHHVEKVEWVDLDKVDIENSLPGTKEILELAQEVS